ncbi:prominin-2 isoform X2 [Synchiropus splendidus]|nr:prominin-2 isoform X2 [Synchiropus splendidus]
MGPCERGQRWWSIATVGVLLVQLSQAQTNPLQASCLPDRIQYGIAYPNYNDTTGKNPAASFISAPVQSFLRTVQPRPFPKDLIQEVYQDIPKITSDQAVIRKVLQYEIGFLVCAAIGVLYIVLMPIVGFFLACCRCCGNCGGNMYQEQTAAIQCRRRTLYWSLLVTTVIIFAGNICMYRSNQALRQSVEDGFQDVNHTLDNVGTFVNALPKQANGVLDESLKVIRVVTENIDAVGPQLGSAIQGRIREALDPTLESVRYMDEETKKVDRQVKDLNSMLKTLEDNMRDHQTSLDAVKSDLNAIVSKPECVRCSEINVELTLPDYKHNTSMSQFQSALDKVIEVNLTSVITEALTHVNSIPETVAVETRDVAEKTKRELELISDLSGQIDLSFLSSVDDMLNQASREIHKATPLVEKAEQIRWKVTIALCCVVLLVVVCNILGLVLGPVGLQHSEDPTKRSQTADCGGTFLMMSAGISFLFSWLFMIIVLVLFILGGNVYTVLCQPWSEGELLEFVDSLDLVSQLSFTTASGDQIKFNISGVYSDCQKNQPVWSTLHLDQVVDLETLLNISKYTSGIKEEFEKLDFSLSDFTLMTPTVKQELNKISAESVDFSAFRQQMSNISGLNLNSTADQLEQLANTQTNSQTKAELLAQADKIRQIQSSIEMTTFPLLQRMESTMIDLETTVNKLKGLVTEILKRVDATQTFLNTQTSQIVKTESKEFLNCQLSYIVAYMNWARTAITEKVGQCGPVANAVDSVETVVCSNLTESLNAFWFSLGWCLIFFIPSIILTIKLAKYYRRMKYSDVHE